MEKRKRYSRIFQLYFILMNESDEEHVMSAHTLSDLLFQRYHIQAGRKIIYEDIKMLQNAGVEIVSRRGSNPGYFVKKRAIQLPELKILVDAVGASRFLTAKKTNDLTNAIIDLAGPEERKLLTIQSKTQAELNNSIKTTSENLYSSIGDIYTAICRDRQIEITYYRWYIDEKKCLCKKKEKYVISPWFFAWQSEYYYLVAYSHTSGGLRHYRVDKILNVKIIDVERQHDKEILNRTQYINEKFGMFSGERKTVTLLCDKEEIGIAIDRFGKEIAVIDENERQISFSVQVSLSPQFYGWLTGVADYIQLKSPGWVRDEYRQYLRKVLEK